MCVFQCRHAHDRCLDACQLKERGCIVTMQGQAIRDYEAYTREQFKSRAAVDLRPSDFERPEQCTEESCRSFCNDKYDDCFTKCGGTISSPVWGSLPSWF